jgi:hypothetical protein
MASITSPEYGAQQECSNTLLCPLGNASGLRSIGLARFVIHFCPGRQRAIGNGDIGYGFVTVEELASRF